MPQLIAINTDRHTALRKLGAYARTVFEEDIEDLIEGEIEADYVKKIETGRQFRFDTQTFFVYAFPYQGGNVQLLLFNGRLNND